MEAAGEHAEFAIQRFCERAAGRGLGILFVSGGGGSAGGYQYFVAVVWDREPVAGGDRVLSGDNHFDQDGEGAVSGGDGDSAGVLDECDVFGGLHQAV